MRNNTTLHKLPSNIGAFLSTPCAPVDPIIEIQNIYNVELWTAVEIYDCVGENYADQDIVAAYGFATPAYIANLLEIGGLSW